MVVFVSVPAAGVEHHEILGREVFLIDEAGAIVWQIDPEPGTTNGRQHDFDRQQETNEPFVNVWQTEGTFYASRFNGDTFRIDMTSGSATYSGWART